MYFSLFFFIIIISKFNLSIYFCALLNSSSKTRNADSFIFIFSIYAVICSIKEKSLQQNSTLFLSNNYSPLTLVMFFSSNFFSLFVDSKIFLSLILSSCNAFKFRSKVATLFSEFFFRSEIFSTSSTTSCRFLTDVS